MITKNSIFKNVFLLCILLVVSFVVAIPAFAELGWYDSGVTPAPTPITCDGYLSSHGDPSATPVYKTVPEPSPTAPIDTTLERFHRYEPKSAPLDKAVLLVIEEKLFFPPSGDSIQSTVALYIDKIIKDYSEVVTITWADGFYQPEQLRDLIISYYNSFGGELLAGCIFIGDLPSAWYSIENDIQSIGSTDLHAEFPVDLYFMDMDGAWGHSHPIADELFETHTKGALPSSDIGPEIWLARICPYATTTALRIIAINKYLDENKTYREDVSEGKTIPNYGARCYRDCNFSENVVFEELKDVYGDNKVILKNTGTSASDFSSLLSSNLYEFVHLGVTSSAFGHTFGITDPANPTSNTGSLTKAGIESIANKQARFYNIVGSSCSRFVENDFIGGAYLFGANTRGLVLVGSTKNGGMQDTKNFYPTFQNNSTIGDCLRGWMDDYIAEVIDTEDLARFCYGMTIIGDPTLKRSCDPATQAILNGLKNLKSYLNNIATQTDNLGHRSYKPATAALAVLDLLNWEIPKTDTAIVNGINYILSTLSGTSADAERYVTGSRNATYNTTCAILALAAMHDPQYHDELRAMRQYLISSQWTTNGDPDNGAKGFGGFGYGKSSGGYNQRADNSNTQFAIMGINIATWELSRNLTGEEYTAERDIPKQAYLNSLTWLANIANGSGNAYVPGGSASHTMTAAAVWNYCLVKDGLKHDTSIDTTALDFKIEAGLNWLDGRTPFDIGAQTSAQFYYSFTLAKAIMMSRRADIFDDETSDWYEKLSNALIAKQNQTTGLWSPYVNAAGNQGWGIPDYTETGFAVAALQVQKENPEIIAAKEFVLHSHADLHLYNSMGKHTGYNETNEAVEELIPGSRYVIYDTWNNNAIVSYEYFRQQEDSGVTMPGKDTGKRFVQKVAIYNPIADTYRIELKGTSEGDYALTIESQKEGEVIETITYEGEIEKIVSNGVETYPVLATYETVANIVGGAPITAEAPEVSPKMVTDTNELVCIARQGAESVTTSFNILEVGGEKKLKVENVFVNGVFSDLHVKKFIYPNEIIIKKTPSTTNTIDPNGSMLVEMTIPIPKDFEGPSESAIKIVTNGGNISLPITIKTNRPPEANAGSDKTLFAGAEGTQDAWVTLEGTATDPDGDELVSVWLENGVQIAEELSPKLKLATGIHTLTLRVHDGKEKSEDSVVITVIENKYGELSITPSVLNRKSHGWWVMSRIALPEGITAKDVDKTFKAKLLTPKGESIEACYQYIIPRYCGFEWSSNRHMSYRWKTEFVAYFKLKDLTVKLPDDGISILTEICKLVNGQYLNGSAVVYVKGTEQKPGNLNIIPQRIYRNTKAKTISTVLMLPKDVKDEDIDTSAKVALYTQSGTKLDPDTQYFYPDPKNWKKSHYKNYKRYVVATFSVEKVFAAIQENGVFDMYEEIDINNDTTVYGKSKFWIYDIKK